MAPPLGDPTPLDVPDVGMVLARRPRPASLATLAMTENPSLKPQERHRYLAKFVADHLGPDEYDRLTTEMIDDLLPADTFGKVAAAIATAGAARPYRAVLILAVTTAQEWREIRRRFNAAGILDPMQLPSMHAVLEFTEAAVIESIQGDDAQVKLAQFYDRLYAPEKTAVGAGKGSPPPGFSVAETSSSFDVFTKAVGGLA